MNANQNESNIKSNLSVTCKIVPWGSDHIHQSDWTFSTQNS